MKLIREKIYSVKRLQKKTDQPNFMNPFLITLNWMKVFQRRMSSSTDDHPIQAFRRSLKFLKKCNILQPRINQASSFIPTSSAILPRGDCLQHERVTQNSSGIALFMVISAISVLAILVTEFTYIAQMSQSIAFGGLDQAKAHYIAKSGFKLSLLRLKAYQQVKSLVKTMGKGAGIPGVPTGMIEKIWNYPFFFPLPTNIPGMQSSDLETIKKFQDSSALDGKYSALIESESSKFNLNALLPYYQATPTPTPSPPSSGALPPTTPTPTPSPSHSFDPLQAQQSLNAYLTAALNQKMEADSDFASEHRDLRVDELTDQITAWSDQTYQRRTSPTRDIIQFKRAPFYSVTELHSIPLIDDELYGLFAPNLTASPTEGVNINTIQAPTLRALIPVMNQDEIDAFFKYRDSEDADNSFPSEEAFYKYLTTSVSAFRNNSHTLDLLKEDFTKRNIRLTPSETHFKITVRAQVNQAVRTIEAWVSLEDSVAQSGSLGNGQQTGGQSGGGQTDPNSAAQTGSLPNTAKPNTGLKINFMRIF